MCIFLRIVVIWFYFWIYVGKYYLGNAGYGNKNGILSPYRSVRYHLKEFSDRPPENKQKLFNLRHSSLRTTIEQGFGVLKKCFRVLDAKPFWSFETQVKVVLACCKDNVFTIDFWWCNEKVFSTLHCYLMVLHCYFQC